MLDEFEFKLRGETYTIQVEHYAPWQPGDLETAPEGDLEYTAYNEEGEEVELSLEPWEYWRLIREYESALEDV